MERILCSRFAAIHVRALLSHYDKAIHEWENGDWETALAKAGKFVEATLKALLVEVGSPLPLGRHFSAGKGITHLKNLPVSISEDSIRLLVPRACDFVYDLTSNRGGRHDSIDIDPNEMDSTAAIHVCRWILAELIRLSQRGSMNVDEARRLVDSLTKKIYQSVEEIEGRVYFYHAGLSAGDIALLALERQFPERLTKTELMKIMLRNRASRTAAAKAISRLKGLVDDDGFGGLVLLQPGRRKAEELRRNS